MSVYDLPAYDDHEGVHFIQDKASGLRAIIAVHSTTLGPALGGCRVWEYAGDGDAVTDVLRLSRGMSYKNAIAGVHLGGGKAVIMLKPGQKKSEKLFEAFGREVERLHGNYITAEDVGSSVHDMEIVAKQTKHVSGLPIQGKGQAAGGDPSPKTAGGVVHGIRAAVNARFGRRELAGLRVAVQGVGSVGYHLCRELHEAGAHLVVADPSARAVARVRDEFGASAVGTDEILFTEVDVLSPCALGAVLNPETIPRLQTSIVAGAANNQLMTEADGERLRTRGILYAPDYVVNAGGVISAAAEYLKTMSEDEVWRTIAKIEGTLDRIFKLSAERGISTSTVADAIAHQRIRYFARMKDKPGNRLGVLEAQQDDELYTH